MANTLIRDVMTTDVLTININDIVSNAAKLFSQNGFHHLPVVDNEGKLKGIISQTDVDQLKVGLSIFKDEDREEHNEALLRALMVEHVMTEQVFELQASESIQEAYQIFKKNQFRAIPIVEADNLVGILTPMDILSHFMGN